MKNLSLFFVLLFATINVFATHQRSGEITYKYLSPLTYEVTIITYSYAPSPADRFELEILWGDGTSSVLQRSNGPLNVDGMHIGEIVGPDIRKNLYVGVHTYPGSASYLITVEDPNRNMGIQNIPNSIETPLFIETQLIINPYIGSNSSPLLSLPPIDVGCVDKLFLHNPGAIDPDGDSLSYKLVPCRGAGGNNIPGYSLPNMVGTNIGGELYLDANSGDLVWNKPKMQGEYNIAFIVEEWRNGIRIGYTTRDMQINITVCNNNSPEFVNLNDTCITAGDTLIFPLHFFDPDGDRITLNASGDAFYTNPPCKLILDSNYVQQNYAKLYWETNCNTIRKAPYTVYLRAIDNSIVPLSSIAKLNISVVAPKPDSLTAIPSGNSIVLNWKKHDCQQVKGYKIYRRAGNYNFEPDICETGVPAYTGYKKIAEVLDINSYTDNDVSRGVEYCYMIVAFFEDNAESYASDEVCAKLKKDLPIITNVSVENTDINNGIINIKWSKPTEIDTIQHYKPLYYDVYRANDFNSTSFTLIYTSSNLDDTTFVDNSLNTNDFQYTYYISLNSTEKSNNYNIGNSQKATSPFEIATESDKKVVLNLNINVPWTNTTYKIYKFNEQTFTYNLIAETAILPYEVVNLENDKEYSFYIETVGTYSTPGIIDPLINLSQIIKATPKDNIAPCKPTLEIETDCIQFNNNLFFEPDDIICRDDIFKTYIYFSNNNDSTSLVLIDSTELFTYQTQSMKLSGCFAIKYVDKNNNISSFSNIYCVPNDICGVYRLPNLFTPNGDEINDLLKPFPYTGVESVDIVILNRWGQVVYKTQDPEIRWDGKIMDSNVDASQGVYFYVGEVFEITPDGVKPRKIQGSITIRR